MPSTVPLGDLLVRLVGDATSFNKMLGEAESRMSKVATKMGDLGKKLTIGVTLPIAGLAVAAVKAASDAEEVESKFNVVFSSVIERARLMAKELDRSYGLSATGAQELLANTADLLSGFGFTQEQALGLSNQVQRLAVDLASFTNIEGGAEAASVALTKGLLGERESMKKLGIAISENTDQYKNMLKQVQDTTGLSGMQAKAMTTLRVAMLQSKNAIGDYGRTSGSLANQTRELLADIRDLRVAFGKLLLPAAKAVVSVGRNIVNTLKDLSPATKQWVVWIAAGAATIGPLLVGMATLLKIATVLSPAILLLAGKVLVLVGSIALLTDAILNLTGTGNLGLKDLVNNFRIAGVSISAWMQVAWVKVFQAWDRVVSGIKIGLNELEFFFRDVGGRIWRPMLEAFRMIATGFLTVMDTMTGGLFSERFQNAITDINKFITDQNNSSLEAREKRWKEYYAELTRLGNEHEANEKKWAETIARIFAKDEQKAAREARAATQGGGVEVPGLPDINLGGVGALGASLTRAAQNFQQINLRRFALEGRGGLAQKQEQKVSAPGVEGKLEDIKTILTNKSQVAVLG